MQRALISWVAWFYDFKEGEVNKEGPTYDLHKRFYGKPNPHKKHLLISTGEEGDDRSVLLFTTLKKDFPEHKIELLCMDVKDPWDYTELKLNAENALGRLKDYEIDILHSNGTTPMRTVWLVLHLENNEFETHLIQGKDRKTTGGEPEFSEIEVDTSIFAQHIKIRSREQDRQVDNELKLQSMMGLYEQAEQIALVEGITTLIEGESGTGKEIMARFIHKESGRKNRRMITVNCAAIGNQELLESRLFGYVKGAFTGADKNKDGLFKDADKSTIFLDEIGDVSTNLQQALLRVLQEREFSPVGSSETHPIDIRVIAATNKDLWEECKKGKFRWDLYYRLTQTRLHLPSFRQYATEDKQAFFRYFLQKKSLTYGRDLLRLSTELEQYLLIHEFPGNIRELENLMTHFYVFAKEEVGLEDLPYDFKRRHKGMDLSLESAKRAHIQQIVDICEGNHTKAMELLDISRNTLKQYLKAQPEN